jgi:hypothetical protein
MALQSLKRRTFSPRLAQSCLISAIEYIPPLARAVLTDDPKEVDFILQKPTTNVDEPVLAKKGERAGYTPLILAAALSDAQIAHTLIEHGAKITIKDDFNRSAFWYAALREDAVIRKILVGAPSAGDVVNAADKDFQRTPLHLAVRGGTPGAGGPSDRSGSGGV